MNIHGRLIALLYAVMLFSACAGSRATRVVAGAETSRRSGATGATAASLSVEAEPDARGLTARAIPELLEIRFAYDSDALEAAARAVLKANAAYLKARPSIDIQIAGHCDERGTEAYNLALGQRRARTVRDFYRHLGVDGARVATISYGRERPACHETGESCWATNRRAETLVMADDTLAGSPPAGMNRQ